MTRRIEQLSKTMKILANPLNLITACLRAIYVEIPNEKPEKNMNVI